MNAAWLAACMWCETSWADMHRNKGEGGELQGCGEDMHGLILRSLSKGKHAPIPRCYLATVSFTGAGQEQPCRLAATSVSFRDMYGHA